MSLNSVCISGNLARDAELRTTTNGMSVLNMSVAVNERRKNQAGEWSDYTNWIDCTMFGSRAEKIAQYLTKGSKVAIQGRLHYSSWQDNNGTKRSKLDVTIDEIEFMSKQNRTQNSSNFEPDSAYENTPIPF